VADLPDADELLTYVSDRLLQLVAQMERLRKPNAMRPISSCKSRVSHGSVELDRVDCAVVIKKGRS
jgi:hypothetical protein